MAPTGPVRPVGREGGPAGGLAKEESSVADKLVPYEGHPLYVPSTDNLAP